MMGSYQGPNRDSQEEQSIDLQEDIQLLKNSQCNFDQTDTENYLRESNPFILRETEQKEKRLDLSGESSEVEDVKPEAPAGF